MSFWTNGTEKLAISSGGSVGITQGSRLYFDGIDIDADPLTQNTYITSNVADSLRFVVGNENMLEMIEDDTQDQVIIGNGTNDVDFIVEDTSGVAAFTVDAGTGNTTIANDLIVTGSFSLSTLKSEYIRHTNNTLSMTIGSGGDVTFAQGPTITTGGLTIEGGGLSVEAGASSFDANVAIKAASGAQLQLNTSDTIVSNTANIGRINFSAPNEGSGGDALLLAASIQAKASADFTNLSNQTDLLFYTATSETATEKMRITHDGKVGIGQSSPGYKLTVEGDVNINQGSYYRVGGRAALNGDSSYHTFIRPNGVTGIYLGGTDTTNYYDNGGHRFRGAGGSGDLAYLTATGLGIGTTSLTGKLHVAGSISSLEFLNADSGDSHLRLSGTGNQRLEFKDSATGANAWIGIPSWNDDAFYIFAPTSTGNEQAYSYDSSTHRFYTGSTEQLAIFSGGGIDMYGGSVDRQIQIGTSRTGNANSYIDFIGDTTYTDYGLRVIRWGYQGVNAQSAIYHRGTGDMLYVNQESAPHIWYIGGGEKMRIDTSGNLKLPNDGQSLYLGAGNDLRLLHSGTESYVYNYSGPLYMGAVSTDQDVFIRGNDGGASINALQFDMSDAGTAIFNHDIWVKTDLGELQFGAGKDGRIYSYEDNFYIGNFTAGKDTIFQNLNSAGSAYVTNLFIDGSAERVGIGTNAPTAKLDVRGNVSFFSSDASDYVSFTHSDNGIIINSAGSTSNKMTLNTGGATAMTIDASQNVGIGTTSPAQTLHIAGITSITGNNSVSGTGLSMSEYSSGGYSWIQSFSSRPLYINPLGNNLVFNRDGGNVGIGLSGPRAKLEITGSNDTTNMIIGAPTHLVGGGSLSEYQSILFDNTQVSGTSGQVLIRHYANSHNDSEGALAILTTSTAGTTAEAMRIRGSGNVGIGTNSPAELLDVDGVGKFRGGSSEGKVLELGQLSYNAAVEAINISYWDDTSGGTSQLTSGDHLEIYGGRWGSRTTIARGGQGGAVPIASLYGGNSNAWLELYQPDSPTTNNNYTTKVRLRADGNSYITNNLGIGTTSLGAGAKLNVVSGSSAYTAQFSRHDADDGLFLHSEAESTHYNWLVSTQDNVDKGFEITPSTAVGNRSFTTPAFVIKADTGNVGIGTNSPPFKLKVNVDNGTYTSWETIAGFQSKRGADTEYEAGIMINSLGDVLGGQISSNYYWTNNVGAKGNTGRSAGVFGISNSTTNESEFYWQTTAYNNTTLTTQMKLDNGQNLHVDGDVVAYSTSVSDKRLKDNIKTIDNALDKVMALRGVEFDWNATSRSGQHDIGLIAQEVEKVIPEVVREKKLQTGEFTDNEKTFKTIDYDKMVGVLIEAIKEQQQQINELKEKLNG